MAQIVVTGSNRGIGLELVRQFKARGDDVVAVCRKSSTELDAADVRIEAGISVADADGPGQLAQRLGDMKIDILINNAGVMRPDQIPDVAADDVRHQLEVNSIAPLMVTQALLPNLREGSKVAIITSRMGSVADNGSGRMYGYRMSKAAVNAAGKSLAMDLKPRGVSVVLLHPGFVKTDMTRGSGNVSPHESAAGLIARLDELDLESTGRFMHAQGEELPW